MISDKSTVRYAVSTHLRNCGVENIERVPLSIRNMSSKSYRSCIRAESNVLMLVSDACTFAGSGRPDKISHVAFSGDQQQFVAVLFVENSSVRK